MTKNSDIRLKLGYVQSKLPEDYKVKWKALLKVFKKSGCRGVCPLFLAELLGILTGKEPGFSGWYDDYDMFGAGGESWKVFAGDLLILRYRSVGEITESWSSVEKEDDETRITGCKKGKELHWDGRYDFDGMTLIIGGVSEAKLARIKTLAGCLFKEHAIEILEK